MTATLDFPANPERIVLHGISWSFYEHTLAEIGKRPIRVAFLDGMMEIISLSPEQELPGRAAADLVKTVAMEFAIPRKAFGATTFRNQEKQAGSEPDECFYFYDIDAYKGLKRFDPLIHRPPDLWIEVDIFSPSVPREPIYARLGVPEVWRYNGKQMAVRLLQADGTYSDSPASRIFPFLPIVPFAGFIPKMVDGDESSVTLEFREWVRKIPR